MIIEGSLERALELLKNLGIFGVEARSFLIELSFGYIIDYVSLQKRTGVNINFEKNAKELFTRSELATELINDGKSNKEVWEILRDIFDLPEKQKYYPAWWRCQLRKTGRLKEPVTTSKKHVEVRYE